MKHSKHKKIKTRVIILLLLGLVIYVLLPQLKNFTATSDHIISADPLSVAACVAVYLCTYAAAALNYKMLAQVKLRYKEVLLVQFAAASINRIIPAGFGGLGANIAYLHNRSHTLGQAAAVAALNNLLGFTGHMILLAGFALATPAVIESMHLSSTQRWLVYPAVMAAAALAIILWRKNSKIYDFVRSTLSAIANFKNRPKAVAAALMSSVLITVCNAGAIYISGYALQVDISVAAALLVLSGGVALSAAVPTPGGLGSFEGGMYLVLLALGAQPDEALAVALLYRLVAFWMPLIIGAFALIIAQKKQLFGVNI